MRLFYFLGKGRDTRLDTTVRHDGVFIYSDNDNTILLAERLA